MKKMIGYALVLYVVMEMASPDWWITAKAEIGKKIRQTKMQ